MAVAPKGPTVLAAACSGKRRTSSVMSSRALLCPGVNLLRMSVMRIHHATGFSILSVSATMLVYPSKAVEHPRHDPGSGDGLAR